MAHLKRTGILPRWARSDYMLLVMLSLPSMVVLLSHGQRLLHLHTFIALMADLMIFTPTAITKGLVSLCLCTERLFKCDNAKAHFGFVPFHSADL